MSRNPSRSGGGQQLEKEGNGMRVQQGPQWNIQQQHYSLHHQHHQQQAAPGYREPPTAASVNPPRRIATEPVQQGRHSRRGSAQSDHGGTGTGNRNGGNTTRNMVLKCNYKECRGVFGSDHDWRYVSVVWIISFHQDH